MKKLLLIVFAVVCSQASAAQLFPVTVNLTPKKVRASIFLINQSKSAPKSASCYKELADTLTCNLPAGTYQLSIYSPIDSSVDFPTVKKTIKVSGKTTINQTVSAKFKTIPSMSQDGAAAFNAIAIAVNGETTDCQSYVFARLCANTPFDIQTVRSLISLNPNLEQTVAWAKAEQFTLGNFKTTAGKTYQILLSPNSDDGTFIQFIVP